MPHHSPQSSIESLEKKIVNLAFNSDWFSFLKNVSFYAIYSFQTIKKHV